MRKFLEQIKKTGITPDLIKEMIESHKLERAQKMDFYERYKASIEGVPILQRQPVEYEDFETGTIKRIDNKVNNKLNNAFDAEIVDTKVGYMFGSPIAYSVDKGETETKTPLELAVEEFKTRNNIEDKDSEWGKKAAICGYGARLAYIDFEGKERITNVNPWDCIFLYSEDITEPEYALRYYLIDDTNFKAEFYDEKKYHVFTQGDNGFVLADEKPHAFDYCPLFGLPNNEELMADAEKVFQLIDAYDRTLSDANNEIEQYRLAYLILKGMGADEETLNEMKRSGIIELLDKDDEVNYLTKQINDAMIENHLNRLEENILRFAKSVNFSDDSFGGNVTGVAMKYKLMALENKCITMERKMTAALRYQFKVLCSAWAKKNICASEDYLKVWFGFKRNLPANVLDEAQTTAQLKGQISEKTRLSLLSFVDDVDYELGEMEAEKDALMARVVLPKDNTEE
ncbi:phage portal protein [Bacillus sp. FJAT-21945]|nr:phage portal protein [Bacillus sp. FJAT-21945]